MLGAWTQPEPWARAVGVLLVAGAVLAFALLQRPAMRLRAAEGRSRWASNARDALNLAGVAALFLAFLPCGYPAPAAALLAGMVGLVLEFVRHAARTPRGAALVCLAVGLAAALPAALLPGPTLEAANRLVAALRG